MVSTARELKEAVGHKDDGDTSCNWCTWNSSQQLGKGAGRVGNWKTNWLVVCCLGFMAYQPL